MCVKNGWKRVTAFSLAFVFGCFSSSALNFETPKFGTNSRLKLQPNKHNLNFVKQKFEKSDGGMGYCRGSNKTETIDKSRVKHLKITSKPRALYTDLARQNTIQGTVILKVTFLSNGTIGNISPTSELPNGLTEQAIEAAKKIKFKTLKVAGQAKTATKSIRYEFTIH